MSRLPTLVAVALLLTPTHAPAQRQGPAPRKTMSWNEIDKLAGEQKLEAAATAALARLEEAKRAGAEEEWARALIRVTQLRIGLHGYETAVRFLRTERWPKDPTLRAALGLYYAAALSRYSQMYQWEIRQRERVESKEPVDLKSWTLEQIQVEIQRAFQEIWAEREALGGQSVGRLGEYLTPSNYPAGIRDTLRDAVTYLWVEHLADTSFWRPEHSNELYLLELAALVRGEPAKPGQVKLEDPSVHPLLRIGALLDELERWHASEGRKEAALEARLQRVQVLHRSFTEAEDRQVIRKDLEARLPDYRRQPWFSAGMAVLAEMLRDGGDAAGARKAAAEGALAFPQSAGGQRCAHLVASIEAPDFQLASMSTDGPGRRSIEVTAKNLAKLHFRAYAVDLEQWLARSRDYNLLPAGQALLGLVRGSPPAHSWAVQLPATPDYRPHKTYVTPPMSTPGLYAVVASARGDFAENENRLVGVNLVVSGMVLVVRDLRQDGVEVSVLFGEGGAPVAGAEVRLYRLDYNRVHEVVERANSDARGVVAFKGEGREPYASYFLLARKGADLALASQAFNFGQQREPAEVRSSVVFTDRSVYRPLQKLMWKVVAFRGDGGSARFQTLADSEITVSLHDPNYQVVETRKVRTNSYGSASGEFTIPTGRLLGLWRISTQPGGGASVRVEEYKRPTFEVSFRDARQPLRLNRPAALTGEARYYFGLPVTSGNVKWKVSRTPMAPWWWSYFGAGDRAQVISAGMTALHDDGTFEIAFTPLADERAGGAKELTYRYEVTADVTDEGGETRSASRSVRLGLLAVEARIEPEGAFLRAGEKSAVAITRTDLDGAPRPGKGRWRVLALDQPKEAVLPADEPVPEPPPELRAQPGPEVVTPGDRQQPRWQTRTSAQETMRRWRDGGERAAGAIEHGPDGVANLSLPALEPGAYRIRYETTDELGSKYETSRELIVAGPSSPLEVPLALLAERPTVKVGQTARFFVHSGLAAQPMALEVYRGGRRVERRTLTGGKDASVVELPIKPEDRGGFSLSLTAVRDFQHLHLVAPVFVPWDDKELKVELSTFRERIRPGSKEQWRITVRGGPEHKPFAAAAELLAYMYDESLDVFAPHAPPSVGSLYPRRTDSAWTRASLGQAWAQWLSSGEWFRLPPYQGLHGDLLKFEESYGIGGPGARFRGRTLGVARAMRAPPSPGAPVPALPAAEPAGQPAQEEAARDKVSGSPAAGEAQPMGEQGRKVELRSDFSETAFFQPHLIAGRDGSATLEFTVPDSVTGWNVWVHAFTRDLRGGSVTRKTRSVKELMVRPYLPRFLREGDAAAIKVVVNNASAAAVRGELRFEIIDPESEQSLLSEFASTAAGPQPFSAEPGKAATLTFPIVAPKRVGQVAFRITATAGDFSDGELRPLPLLPSRMHLAQSRFVTLRGKQLRSMSFPDMAKGDDATLLHEQLVVTVDAQLFYSVLSALPYLKAYPYECTEQTLNRFLSAGIVSSVYRDNPLVARMAKQMSKRETRFETFDAQDPNRKMALEETPWLIEAKGGKRPDAEEDLTNVLDPRVAEAERASNLAKLRKAQTSLGGFPWWPGGPPSPYMTLYIAHGFAKASELGVEVPKDVVQRAWQYLARHFREEYAHRMMKEGCCWEFLTFLNYVASSYPDPSWTGDALTEAERKQLLDFSFKHWKQHSPYLKGYLALTLRRMGRPEDAAKVFDSVMDSAKTTPEEGTYWAPEDRAWLWYNDTIETHAFALRALLELSPSDPRRDGLVQWLLINKKLNHWKSTKATAEVIYSLVKVLQGEKAIGVREDSTVTIGKQRTSFVFEPDEYTGKRNQIVVRGPEIDPRAMSTITVEKTSKGFQFASATWHFSTERLPAEGKGDLFAVSRKYFRRDKAGREAVLRPLEEGQRLVPGDEVEVHLSLRSRHQAEYVHLRDPRGAGLEPENAVSRYRWDLGVGWYEEVRDSGTNFFFESLPAGEYTFKYRLRANLGGTFRVGPATVQSMYAPEFAAYSAGQALTIGIGGR
ncbi:MAG: hypothetical protein HYZ28_15425 [Myxococcales bacterium]|nr:hypothetical protein [Myxococcales bacterium]